MPGDLTFPAAHAEPQVERPAGGGAAAREGHRGSAMHGALRHGERVHRAPGAAVLEQPGLPAGLRAAA